MMRIRVVGGGIAGVLLSWRLAAHAEVELYLGATAVDATRASGGFVRGWEADPAQRRLAVASLGELLGDARLRQWSRYTETGCVVAVDDHATVRAAADEIDRQVPNSVHLWGRKALDDRGWRRLPAGAAALFERRAGHLDPHALRSAVLADLRNRRTVTVIDAAAPGCSEDGPTIVAAGAWTPSVLAAFGHRTAEFRTKAIEYSVYRTGGWRPLPFIDTMTGLYGRPTPEGLLLGVPTRDWDVAPGASRPTPSDRAAQIASRRFPLLELRGVVRQVRSADCYAADGLLRLRPVAGSLYTFTGGSGGAAKTALAASRIAAESLIGSPIPLSPATLAGDLR
jgi:glycine/D-amino acid oxidase-like deaminating enzyme